MKVIEGTASFYRKNIIESTCERMRKIAPSPETYFTLYTQQRTLKLHEERIKNVQPTIHHHGGFTSRMSHHVKKQPLAEFNRLITIEIENKALLKKLTDKTHSTLSHSRPHKLVKNNRKKMIEDHEKRILDEGLLKRLKEVKSSYQCKRFAEERKKTERILQSRSMKRKQHFNISKSPSLGSKPDELLEETPSPTTKGNSGYNRIVRVIPLQKSKVRSGERMVKAYVRGVVWANSVNL